jgi:acyl carrier protein
MTVLDEIEAALTQVVGDDLLLAVDITPDTRFDEDLALESIEFVALGEQLRERYGERVDFVGFIANLELDEIMSLTVGRLEAYIVGCLGTETPATAG